MKAIVIHQTGGPDVMKLEDTPRPTPAANEVLIRVKAASVNPVDYKIRSGNYKKTEVKLPLTLGRDVAGIIEEVGKDVTDVKVGDEVFAFLGSHSGGYAEFAIAQQSEIARKPTSISFTQAAAVPLAAITAWQALFVQGHLRGGETVLIHGAGGGVGHFAVQFAKVKGAKVYATTSPEDVSLVQSLGADFVIDYKKTSFEDEFHDVDLVIDLIGGETQRRSWRTLKPGGRMVSTLEQPSAEEAKRLHATATVFMAQPRANELAEIGGLIDAGKITVAISRTLPLNRASEAHRAIEDEHTQGKVVLSVS